MRMGDRKIYKMDHKNWIKGQFKKEYTSSGYRNVLIHTSFIETIVKKETEARGVNFDCAIKILKANSKYNSDKLVKIDKLRNKRNIIMHELLENQDLDEDLIDSTIKRMRNLLKEIYHNSSFIQSYFKKEYGIDTKKFK